MYSTLAVEKIKPEKYSGSTISDGSNKMKWKNETIMLRLTRALVYLTEETTPRDVTFDHVEKKY